MMVFSDLRLGEQSATSPWCSPGQRPFNAFAFKTAKLTNTEEVSSRKVNTWIDPSVLQGAVVVSSFGEGTKPLGPKGLSAKTHLTIA